jgi:hypothetical protein
MKLAIMQPYFFPYIGYWQLIRASDTILLLDDVQFMRHAWIERNRILNPNGGWQYIRVPLEKHSHKELIRNIIARDDHDWRAKLIGQLAHYKRVAPYYSEVCEIIRAILDAIQGRSICKINSSIVASLCQALDLRCNILIASECELDYGQISNAGHWALRISEQMGAQEYVNPISGMELFDADEFSSAGIRLTFLKPDEIVYRRNGSFIPWLSIIDVLMFNGIDGTRLLLDQYRVETARASTPERSRKQS